MDASKIELIVRYALARAAHGDTPWERQLGPIHLLKAVYLADLAFAERNQGASFTGAEWVFYHYGPWSPAVMGCVRAVAVAIAMETVYSSTKYESDTVRWSIADLEEAAEVEAAAERDLPGPVMSAVKRAVRDYGTDTTGLLHHVYGTPPMLNAAPHERLDFTSAVASAPPQAAAVEQPPISRRQEKKREEALRELHERAKKKLTELRERRALMTPARRPRYDEVFVAGQRWLDELGGSVEEAEGEVEFDEGVWKSPWRSDPGTP